MAFAMPPKVSFSKTVNGSLATVTIQVKDNNNQNIGVPTSYDFDMTQTTPLAAWKVLMQAAVDQVNANLAWTDMPASGNLTIPTVDCIQNGAA